MCPDPGDVALFAEAMAAVYPGYGRGLALVGFGAGLRISEALALARRVAGPDPRLVKVDRQLDRYVHPCRSRDRPRPDPQRPRTGIQLRATPTPAPTRTLALGRPMANPLDHRHDHLIAEPRPDDPRTQEKPDPTRGMSTP